MAKGKRFTPDLTATDVMDLYRLRYQDGDEGRMRRIATEMRAHCRLEKAVKIPKQYQSITKDVRTPFIRDAAQRITSSLLAKQPIVHITPKNLEKREYRDAASTAERADMALKERLNKERGEDLDYNLTYNLVRDGGSVLKVAHRPEAWANFPKRQSDEETADDWLDRQNEYKRGVDLPIIARDIDRMSIVYEGGEYGDDWVIEYGEYTKAYAKAHYRMSEVAGNLVNPALLLEGRPLSESLKASATGMVTKIEFFNSREWHVIIDGMEAPGWPKANPYTPYLPYFRAKAYDEESLLYSLLFLVPRLDELLTMQLNHSYLNAYAIPVLGWASGVQGLDNYAGAVGNAGDTAGPGPGANKTVRFEPGKFFDVPWGRTLSFLQAPQVGGDLDKLVTILKSLIDTAGIPSIMRGISGSGDSGYLANQLRAAAQMSFKLAASTLQRQQEKAFEFIHWLIERVIQQPVYVLGWESIDRKTGKPSAKAEKAWLALAPEVASGATNKNIADLSKIATVEIKYRVQLPTDEQAMVMIAIQAMNAPKPLYSHRDVLEKFMQEEDPDAIADRIWVEKAEETPELLQQVMDHALQEAGLKPPTPQPAPAGGLGGGVPNGADIPAAMLPPGAPGQPGINMPLNAPAPKKGKGGGRGGRVAGSYPGQPGGPNLKARTT